MAKKEDGQWVTIRGRHVFIKEGETPEQALNRSIAETNERVKQEQIAKNKANADKLNGRVPTKDQPTEYKGYRVFFDGDNYSVTVSNKTTKFKSYPEAKAFIDKQPKPFEKGRVVVALDDYLDKGESVKDTAELVIDHNPENNYLVTGVLHPEKYAIAPTFSRFGGYYRYATDDELKKWGFK